MDPVLVERPTDRLAHVVLNRPERRDALTGPLVKERRSQLLGSGLTAAAELAAASSWVQA